MKIWVKKKIKPYVVPNMVETNIPRGKALAKFRTPELIFKVTNVSFACFTPLSLYNKATGSHPMPFLVLHRWEY